MNPNIYHRQEYYPVQQRWESEDSDLWSPISAPPENIHASAPELSDDEDTKPTDEFHYISLDNETENTHLLLSEQNCSREFGDSSDSQVWVMPTNYWENNHYTQVILEDDPYYQFPKLGWWEEKLDSGLDKLKNWWQNIYSHFKGCFRPR